MNPSGTIANSLHCRGESLIAAILDETMAGRTDNWPGSREFWASSHVEVLADHSGGFCPFSTHPQPHVEPNGVPARAPWPSAAVPAHLPKAHGSPGPGVAHPGARDGGIERCLETHNSGTAPIAPLACADNLDTKVKIRVMVAAKSYPAPAASPDAPIWLAKVGSIYISPLTVFPCLGAHDAAKHSRRTPAKTINEVTATC